MTRAFDSILKRARRVPGRIGFPEATDPRVLEAAATIVRDALASPVLIGNRARIEAAAADGKLALDGCEIEEPSTSSHRESVATVLTERLAPRGIDRQTLDELSLDPLYFGAALLRGGGLDGLVAGAVHSTAETLRAALRVVGPATSGGIVSSYFLMGLARPTPSGESLLAFADCGLVPRPDAAQLAEIARQTAGQFRGLLGAEPRVALVAFSTKGSAEDRSLEHVRGAVQELLGSGADFPFDGELQVDAALIPEVAATKAPGSPVAGSANVLIFPDLNSGNIAYKLVERLAGAQAVGPLLQGLARPVNDLSRGCGAEDIVVAAAITALQAAETT